MCDFQTLWDRRGFSGRSELRVLRRHSLVGQLLQSSTRLALSDPAHAYKAELSVCTDKQATVFQELLLGVYPNHSAPGPGSLVALSLSFGLTGFSNFMLKRFRELCLTGRIDTFQCTLFGI